MIYAVSFFSKKHNFDLQCAKNQLYQFFLELFCHRLLTMFLCKVLACFQFVLNMQKRRDRSREMNKCTLISRHPSSRKVECRLLRASIETIFISTSNKYTISQVPSAVQHCFNIQDDFSYINLWNTRFPDLKKNVGYVGS